MSARGRPPKDTRRMLLTVSVAGLVLLTLGTALMHGPGHVLNGFVLGMTLLCASGVVAVVDAYRPWRRPAPRTEPGATVLPWSRGYGAIVLLGASGMAAMMAWVAVDGGLDRVIDPREAGLAAVAVVLIPLWLVWGVSLLVRPYRVELSPEGLAFRKALRTHRVRWDDVTETELVLGHGDGLKIGRRGRRPLTVPTPYLAVGPFALREVVLRQWHEPDQRRYLGTDAELERLADLQRSTAR